jgi:hypothetical protein
MTGTRATTWQPGHAARHEAGHAAAGVAAGTRFTHVTIGPGYGQDMTHFPPGGLVLGTIQIVTSMAGFIADYQAWNRTIRGSQIRALLLGDRSGTFTVDCPQFGPIVFGVASWTAPGMDFERISAHFRSRRGDPFAAADAVAIWRDAEAYVAALRPAIDAIAGALLTRRELSRDECVQLATAAAGGCFPPLPEWAKSAAELDALCGAQA